MSNFRHPLLFFSFCLRSSCITKASRTNVVESESEPSAIHRNSVELPFWTAGDNVQLCAASNIASADTTQSAIALRQTLEDPELLERFIIFARDRRAPENILFLRDYLNIQRNKEVSHTKQYDELILRYLDKDSRYEVNLPSDLAWQLQSRASGYFVNVTEIIRHAVDVVFNDLKLNPIFPAFIKAERDALTEAFNGYIPHASRADKDAFFADPIYERLIRFILAVQNYERETPGRNKKAQGRKVHATFVVRGSRLEIPGEFVGRVNLEGARVKDYSVFTDMRIAVIHYLLTFEEIVKKARVWEEATTVRRDYDGSPKLTMM